MFKQDGKYRVAAQPDAALYSIFFYHINKKKSSLIASKRFVYGGFIHRQTAAVRNELTNGAIPAVLYNNLVLLMNKNG